MSCIFIHDPFRNKLQRGGYWLELSLSVKYTRNKTRGAWSRPVWDSGKTVERWIVNHFSSAWSYYIYKAPPIQGLAFTRYLKLRHRQVKNEVTFTQHIFLYIYSGVSLNFSNYRLFCYYIRDDHAKIFTNIKTSKIALTYQLFHIFYCCGTGFANELANEHIQVFPYSNENEHGVNGPYRQTIYFSGPTLRNI